MYERKGVGASGSKDPTCSAGCLPDPFASTALRSTREGVITWERVCGSGLLAEQLSFETHPYNELYYLDYDYITKTLKRLEKCFLLYRRDAKFFKAYIDKPYGFLLTEWQIKNGFLLNTTFFEDEISLSKFLFSIGELYFVNENFLN